MRIQTIITALLCLLLCGRVMAADLLIHEWGTITTRHYNNGWAAQYMNRIDASELLPEFVHKMPLPEVKRFGKGVGMEIGHPDVTMRLETPVLYFYPGKNFKRNTKIDIEVFFQGGLLNEYYPNAKSWYQGLPKDAQGNPMLTAESKGYLAWRGLQLDDTANVPQTQMPVWLAPREVAATPVKTTVGEAEKYLFYRGVANLPALFQTRHKTNKKALQILKPVKPILAAGTQPAIPAAWLLHVKQDGSAAFVEIGRFNPQQLQQPKQVMISDTADYSKANLQVFRQTMHAALMQDGLFADEAMAMLNTWDQAYFRQSGARVLYIVPKQWIEAYLPLTVNVEHTLVRTLVGRIDLQGFPKQ